MWQKEKKMNIIFVKLCTQKAFFFFFFLRATKAQRNTNPEHIITFPTSLVQAVWQQLKVLFSLVCREVSWLVCYCRKLQVLSSDLHAGWFLAFCAFGERDKFANWCPHSILSWGQDGQPWWWAQYFGITSFGGFRFSLAEWQQFCMWCLLPVSISKQRFNEQKQKHVFT